MAESSVRLVSAGTGKSVPVPGDLTVAELRELANLSDDVTLAFNGSTVTDEENTIVPTGSTVVEQPPKIGHGE
jgi:poly(A) polymerase Pap1